MASVLVAAACGGAMAQAPAAQAPVIGVTPQNARIHNYLKDLAGPPTFIRVVGGSVFSRWDGGGGALGQEIASRAGQMAIEVSVQHGLAAVMQHSTEYQPCDCRGFGNKIEHALLETFTDRQADGTRAIAVPRMAGAYAGRFARAAWERDGAGAQDVLLGTTLSFGLTAVFNMARELTGVGR